MTNQPELKACPFCGAPAKIDELKTLGTFLVFCTEDNEDGYCHVSPELKSYVKKEEAIRQWNKRADVVIRPSPIIPEDAATRTIYHNLGERFTIDKVDHDVMQKALRASVKKIEPVSDDELREAVDILRDCRILVSRYTKWSDAKVNYAIETLVTHAIKTREEVVEVSADNLYREMTSYGGKEVDWSLPVASVLKSIAKKYPNGLKIIDGGE